MGRTLACAATGLLGAYAGWRLLKNHEKPVERTGFHTVPWTRSLGYAGGYVLLFLGLYLLCIQSPMFWIARQR
jgi:hypothetical protein